VVEWVAERDGISQEKARRYVEDTLLFVAARREQTPAEQDDALSQSRLEHLRRQTKAWLWLKRVFEPAHQPKDIPDDAPELVRARTNPKLVHPRLHRLCQIVAVPNDDDPERRNATAKSRAWLAATRSLFDRVADRFTKMIHASDPDPCTLMKRLLGFATTETDTVELRFESGAFHLDACARTREDGSCAEPRWATEWTERVAQGTSAGFLPVFATRFGLHLVFLVEVLPERTLADPQTDAFLRDEVSSLWRRNRFEARLRQLWEQYAVQVAAGPSESP
jgi:hypothetical protein